MKIHRPDNLGILYRSLRFARRDTLAIGMIALFRFDRGEPTDLLPEPQLWAAAKDAMGEAMLDEGLPKPAAEYKVYGKGHAHAGGTMGQDIPVSVRLSGLSKQALLTAKQEFQSVPFWGLAPDSPQRKSLLGAFDDRWLKSTWPHLPEDTRIEYFMSAPADQRFPAFLEGGEALELRNLHPSKPVLSGRLPNVRARCFVNRRTAGGTEEFSEVQARLETVWLLPGSELGIVLFRAQAACADEDASDVLQLMAEWESRGAAPLPFTHYHELFEQKRAKKPRPAASVKSAAPQPAAAAVPAAAAGSAVAAPAAAPLAPPDFSAVHAEIDKLNQETQALMQKHGLTQADLAPYLKQEPEGPALSLDDIKKQVDALNQETQALMAKHKITQDDIAPFLKAESQAEEVSLKDVKTMLRDLNQETQGLMQKHGITDQDMQALVQKANPEAAPWKGMADLAAQVEAVPEVLPEIPSAAAALAAAPAAAKAPEPKVPAAVQQLTREEVIARHAAKQSLGGYDLSGVDLSKLDLSGADFTGGLLTGTVFTGSTLRGAKFDLAVLKKADFSDADLTQATLRQASASEGKFAKAILQGAQLSQGDFTGADFSEAKFTGGANLANARFDGARLNKVQASGCSAPRATFGGADLSGADFSKADLTKANFMQGKLAATDFSGSQCVDTEFHGAQAAQAKFQSANLRASRAGQNAQFTQADFSGAALERAHWDGATLSGAIFAQANLDHADFSNTKATETNFQRASAKGAKFGKADLSRANLSSVNLFKGSLRKATLTGALLRQSNLYGVNFEGTQPTIAMLEGSNIDNTLLVIRPPAV